jgi:hypothetical protein
MYLRRLGVGQETVFVDRTEGMQSLLRLIDWRVSSLPLILGSLAPLAVSVEALIL